MSQNSQTYRKDRFIILALSLLLLIPITLQQEVLKADNYNFWIAYPDARFCSPDSDLSCGYNINVFDPNVGQVKETLPTGRIFDAQTIQSSINKISYAGADGFYTIGLTDTKPSKLVELADRNDVNAVFWSPSGKYFAFTTNTVNGPGDLYLALTNNASNPVRLTNMLGVWGIVQWSSDEKQLLFSANPVKPSNNLTDGSQIYVINSDGSQLTQVSSNGFEPFWSRAGEKIAYQMTSQTNLPPGISDTIGVYDIQDKTQTIAHVVPSRLIGWPMDDHHVVIASYDGLGNQLYLADVRNSTLTFLAETASLLIAEQGSISPDGRYLVYSTGGSGINTISDACIYDLAAFTVKCFDRVHKLPDSPPIIVPLN